MGTLGLFPALTWCQIFLTKRKREQQNGLVPFLSHDGGGVAILFRDLYSLRLGGGGSRVGSLTLFGNGAGASAERCG
jgi:hypothetical protein